MKSYPRRDFAPWLLLPSIVLTLGSVTLLAPHGAAQAAPAASAQPAPKTPVYDDGDGDELLEHWDDPQYSREERRQLGGIAVGFLVLGVLNTCCRVRRSACEVVHLPSEADFLKLASPADCPSPPSHRKAA